MPSSRGCYLTAVMTPNVAVHPAEGRRGAPPPRIGCNGSLDLVICRLDSCLIPNVTPAFMNVSLKAAEQKFGAVLR